jgi:basic amino acid/polyamine antiporter, APA family
MIKNPATPRKTLSLADAVALIIGVVIGIGIFKTPSIVAAHTGNPTMFFLVWILGGIISLLGGLCYAELASTYPSVGGDYFYVSRAFGRQIGFLFAWSRMTVIQTGSIAMLGFVFGDYASQIAPIGDHSSSVYAAGAIIVLTLINLAGIRQGKWAQNILSLAKVSGLLLIVFAGVLFFKPAPSFALSQTPSLPGFSLAMIFVLLTYGGWNEFAYISAELRNGRKNTLRALLWGIIFIMAIYLLINYAFLRILGFAGLGRSEAVMSDAAGSVFGINGVVFSGILIGISALSAINATMITGARTTFAAGRDFSFLAFFGRWNKEGDTPRNALMGQAVIAVILVVLGTVTRKGFITMVEYTAPVFWAFFSCVIFSLFVLRAKDAGADRPFRVPLYPVTPAVFLLAALYMLYASVAYTGIGALAGLGVLFSGLVFLYTARNKSVKGDFESQ